MHAKDDRSGSCTKPRRFRADEKQRHRDHRRSCTMANTVTIGSEPRILENLRRRHHSNYRAVEYSSTRQGLSPFNARRIDGDQIPQRSASLAAIRFGLAGARVRHSFCQRMLFIPELPYPPVRQATERTGRWRNPIGRQDRLPNREHRDLRFRMLFKQFLGCGGPPQTHRSRRRKQQDNPDPIGGSVEVSLQRSERSAGQFRQRRLAFGHLMASEVVARNHSQHDDSDDHKYSNHCSSHCSPVTESNRRSGQR